MLHDLLLHPYKSTGLSFPRQGMLFIIKCYDNAHFLKSKLASILWSIHCLEQQYFCVTKFIIQDVAIMASYFIFIQVTNLF